MLVVSYGGVSRSLGFTVCKKDGKEWKGDGRLSNQFNLIYKDNDGRLNVTITPLSQSANQNVHTQRGDGLGTSHPNPNALFVSSCVRDFY